VAFTWDEVPVPLIGWRDDGSVVAVNTAAATALGYSREELIARSYWSLTLSGQKQRELALVQRRELPYGKEFLRPDGAPITVRVIGCTTHGEGDDAHNVCAFTVDTGEQPGRDIEAALRWQNHLLLRLGNSNAIDAGDLERALPAITEAAAAGLGCARASVWLYTAGAKSIRCEDLFLRDPNTHESGLELFARDFPRYFAALAEDRTIAASDAHTHPATREFSSVYLAPLGIGAMLEAPIRRMGVPVGVLCNEHVGPARSFSQEEQHFAAAVADVVARTLDAADRRRAEEALARANEELEEHAARLEDEVAARTRELEARHAENRALIDRLRGSVEALSSPVLEVWQGVLAMPLIGPIDRERAGHLTARLLDELTRTRAQHAILDLTGAELRDTEATAALLGLVRAARLLGAECIVTGMQPATAHALVTLGAELTGIETRRNMQQALQVIVAGQR
jgi:rsbT co-antagonist protein RsbR